jgi:NAD(P)-dependent dehydrogenase (short-subunit alcohol dehydrogenase family)
MTAVHVAGPYYLAVKFIPLFKASNDPSICNITSLATVFLNRYVRRVRDSLSHNTAPFASSRMPNPRLPRRT